MPLTARNAASLARRLAPDWRTVLSALLIVLAFPPWDAMPLIWIALVPWLAALRRAASVRAAFVQGVWLSFFMSVGGFFWIAHTLRQFGNLPWPVAILGLVLYSFAGQPQFLAFAPLWKALELRTGLRAPSAGAGAGLALALVSGLLYSGIDWVIPKLFVDTLGHALYSAERIRQAADLGGASLLTLAVFLLNAALWECWSAFRAGRGARARLPQLALALSVCAALWAYGLVRLGEIRELQERPARVVQTAVIQANIGDFEKVAAEQGVRGAARKVLGTFFDMSDQALALSPKPELLVWPETSYPSTFRNPGTSEEQLYDQSIERFVRERGVPLLFGGYDFHQRRDYNALFLLTAQPQLDLPGGKPSDLQVYRKNILLLFGEYIPGSEHLRFIKRMFPQVANFGRGIGPDVVRVPFPAGGSFLASPVICYEALFANYAVGGARKGSQLIVNVTNDSWFGPLGEPQLHLALVTFRSIETRLPQLRATNTGISTLILPDGEITSPSAIGEARILNLKVPLLEPIPTLVKAWGDWFGPTAFALGLGWLAFLLALDRKRRAGSS
jgi:apolipoprotein N-acyltransferase